MALLATTTVFVIIITVMALCALAGFKNGMYEAVFTIIMVRDLPLTSFRSRPDPLLSRHHLVIISPLSQVGMSIDYAVHLAHFYNAAAGPPFV